MDVLRIGIVGLRRGAGLWQTLSGIPRVQVTAVCERDPYVVRSLSRDCPELFRDVTVYTDSASLLEHALDAVVLANAATEHAPLAITAMNHGMHVISEVLPCQSMQEAVALIETMEKTGRIYCCNENYCFLPACRQMRSLYRAGKIGELEYGEGEYLHNMESFWPELTRGKRGHWRNSMNANFYCMHSIGPLLHATGLRPVQVTGFELPFSPRRARMGSAMGAAGIEMITLNNGAVIRSMHGLLDANSVFFSLYGSRGHMECNRSAVSKDIASRIYLHAHPYEDSYEPMEERVLDTGIKSEDAVQSADTYALTQCVNRILGDTNAEAIGIYEAMDMFLPGIFAYFGVLAGGVPQRIPDLRKPEERDLWRNDRRCCDAAVAGDMRIPTYSRGDIDIEEEVFERLRQQWEERRDEGAVPEPRIR